MDPTTIAVLDTGECLRLLARQQVGRIGVTAAGAPLILPVNYALDRDTVVFRTAGGGTLEAAVRGALVAFEVDELQRAARSGWSVLVRGRVDVVEDPAEVARLDRVMARPWAPGARPRLFRLVPETITGRRLPVARAPEPPLVVPLSSDDEIEVLRQRLTPLPCAR